MQRTIPFAQLIVSLAVVGILGVPPVQAQTIIDGQLPNDLGSPVGKIITIADASPMIGIHCGSFWFEYEAVVSDPAGSPSLTRIVSLPDIHVVAVADQFEILSQFPCDGQYQLTLLVLPPVPTLDGQLPNDLGSHVGKIITITDAIPMIGFHCGSLWFEYAATVSDPAGSPSLTRIVSLPDTLFVSVGDQFEVLVIPLEGGSPELIQRDYELVRLTEDDFVEFLIEAMAGTRIGDQIPWNSIRRNFPEEQTRPAITSLRLDAEGNLWVEEGRTDYDSPGIWHVYGPSHSYLATATMPSRFRPFDIGTESVLGVWRDDFDVEYVQLRGIMKRDNP